MFSSSLTRSRGVRTLRRRGKYVVLAWAMLVFFLPAGAAYAMWSSSGTGDGAAKATTAVALTVTAGTPVADMYPGRAGAVVFSVNNPNSYGVSLTSASNLTMGAITNVFGGGACVAGDFTLSGGTITGTIPANSTASVTLTGALAMKTSAPDGCQGVNVAVNATLNGTQA